jgi:NitT/TauT family transport system ATP-binding protein
MAIAAKRQEAPVSTPTTSQIEFADATLVLGGKTIIENLNLGVRPGEFLCIVGASGCGKTTALRLAAGLYQPTSGRVNFDGQPMREPRREIAIVFQDYGKALLPWRTAAGNISLALEAAGVKSGARDAKIKMLLEKVGLPNHAEKYPAEMSGGMQQRLQIARCLAQEPAALMMDEPFGALDAMTRDLLHDELERIVSVTGVSVLFVTHNVREAARLADRVVLLTSRPGRVAAEFDARGIARPRRIESREVSSLASTITDRLRAEVARHGRR